MKKAIGYLLIAYTLLFRIVSLSPAMAQSSFEVKFCDAEKKILSTAIGCFPTTPTEFATKLIGFSIGIAGGLAFLMIVLGGFQIQMSAGNPESMQSGREMIEGAVVGLLLIIFSVFILKVIGVNILAIPGFQ